VAREYGLVIGKVSCEQFMKSAGSTYVKRSGVFFLERLKVDVNDMTIRPTIQS
jgi:hypothetical protein